MPKKNTGPRLQFVAERKCYYVVWFEQGNRRRVSASTDDHKQAQEFFKDFIQGKTVRQHSKAGRLVKHILFSYAEEHSPHVTHPEDIDQSIKALLPFFGPLRPDQVNKIKCQDFAVYRRKDAAKKDRTISDATIRRNLAHLQAAFHHDKEAERLEKVPTMWLPEKPQARDRWFTRKEAAALIRAARNLNSRSRNLPWFILLSLYSGQRMRAVLNLTWDRVDLERGKINWQYGRATNKRRPQQPMPDEVKMFLRFLSKYGTKGYVLHNAGEPVLSIRNGYDSAVKNAGLPHASPHTLKHSAITWMLQNGTDPWSVSGFTGTSVHTITTVYGHHASDYMETARNSSKNARRRRVTATDTATRGKNVVNFERGRAA